MENKNSTGEKSKEIVPLDDSDLSLVEHIVLPQDPKILKLLKENVFVEGVHYIKEKNSKGKEIIIFTKNASSVITDLFNINVEVLGIDYYPYYEPSYDYIMQNLIKMAENLMEKGNKSAEIALNKFADLAKRENKQGLWRIEAKIRVSNKHRTLEWVGLGVNSIIKNAQASALTRAFRNGIKAFVGL